MLGVQSPHLVYSRVRITVSSDDSVHASSVSVGDQWSNHRRPLPMPLILKPRPRPIHYIVRAFFFFFYFRPSSTFMAFGLL